MNASVMGQQLRSLRGSLTVQEMADILHITKSSLVKYERGERVPRDEVKIRIAQYFGVSLESLFFNLCASEVKEHDAS